MAKPPGDLRGGRRHHGTRQHLRTISPLPQHRRLTTGEVSEGFAEIYGASVSRQAISGSLAR
jgi:hypothetical protein